MVTRQTSAPARSPRRRGMLTRKLFRDMRRSGMQFLAMMLLCALGTWTFSGLDATWRMLNLSVETYFESGHLADAWIKGAGFTTQQLREIEHIPGVAQIQPRITLEMDVPDLPDSVSLAVHGYDGEMRINTPLLREGELLQPSDLRGCLIEEQFAQYHDLHVGERITLEMDGLEMNFTIRGIILSSEYLMTAKDVTPDPAHYGFLYVSGRALQAFPFTEVLLDLEDGAVMDDVRSAIEDAAPGALILEQTTHASTASARNFVSLFRNMSYLFPVIVFAVAAMIVVSTLTRMMENQRIQMGTLKALGFRDAQIRTHYLSYALVPSLIGSLLGLFAGQWTIPYVLWPMFETNMRFPWRMHAPISMLAWGMTAVSVLLSVFICLHTYRKTARETTASLLRPKPPKSGTRILLERVTFLWRRFSFNTKMIVRNLMRSKGRTAMTLVGVICCNMLIICTFGLQESISWFVGRYYHGTIRYDMRVELDTTRSGTLDSYRSRIDAAVVDGVMELSVSASSQTQQRSCLLSVLTPDQSTLFLGEDATMMALPDSGLAISKKLAQTLGVSIGDTLTLWLTGDSDPLDVTVNALCETNIGQGLYMSRRAWESCRKGDFMPTALLVVQPSAEAKNALHEMDEFSSFKDPNEQEKGTMRIMDSTSMAFTILSAAALALAFIICYNMGLMSFTERTRDYATLKVLGYHQKEIRGLMMRENNLTAILGVLIGIFPGIWLTDVILKMCEYETMVFAANVTFASVIKASLITYAFTFFIEWLLTRKVRSIDMVEALKSVE